MFQNQAQRSRSPRTMSGGFFGREKGVTNDPVAVFLRRSKKDINYYFNHINFKPTWQQKELVDAFVAGVPNIAVRSGKGPGKTAATGALVPWWNLTNPMSQAVITAPTMAQCKNVWLSQAQKWVMNGDPKVRYFFNFTGTGYGIRSHHQTLWGGYLRTATNPEGFQGIHNEKLLIYCEEASGISRPIMQAIQDTLTGNKEANTGGGQNVWLTVGNPNTRTCRFFDFFHSLADNPWKCIHWNAEETPISAWFSGERNTEIEAEFGRDSDVYRVAVLGEFPSIDPDSILSELDVNKCFGPDAYDRAFAHPDDTKQIGVDLARMGGDECCSVYRTGRICLAMEAQSKVEPLDWIDRTIMNQVTYQWADDDCMYVQDTSGLGEAAAGYLGGPKRAGKQLHEFYSQNTAYESDKFADKISEAWFGLRKLVRSGDLYLGDKPDRRLVIQLTNRKYALNNKGLLKVESKDEYKKRLADIDSGGELGKSPDRADAMVMAFYEHATQSQRVLA